MISRRDIFVSGRHAIASGELMSLSQTLTTGTSEIDYRPDVDGLRAIAVSVVVLYHAGVSGIPGGFVGVDVFFVISGFLITAIIVRELEEQHFSILTFYERRIRRLFPALFVHFAVTAVIAYQILLPQDLKEFGQSLLSAAGFVANIFFWAQSGYFNGATILKPLLHTWTLAVEEQFYIFFPPILILLARFSNRRLGSVLLGAVALGSFALSVWAVRDKPVAAFYWLPTRAWELLFGAIVALDILPPVTNRIWREILSGMGFCLVVGSIVIVTKKMPFPGVAATPPCVGAALLIHAQRRGLGVVGRLLSLKPVVFVGLISYSLYLWHWPLLVFARYRNIAPLSPVQTSLVVCASTVLAILSWRFVERPFRWRGVHISRRPAIIVGCAVVACAALCGGAFAFTDGLPGRVPANVIAVTDARQYRTANGGCHMFYTGRRKDMCVRGARGVAPSFLLVGDSHAGAAADSIFKVAQAQGIAGFQLTDSGFCPTFTYLNWRERSQSRSMNNALRQKLDNAPGINLVVVVAYWDQAIQSQYYGPDGDRVDGSVAVLEGIKAMAQRYPDKTFLLMEAPPHSPLFGAHVRAREILYQKTVDSNLSTSQYEALRAPYEGILRQLSALPNVHKLDIEQYVCSAHVCPSRLSDGTLLYRDDNHMSVAGADLLIPLFKKTFARFAAARGASTR